MVKKKKHDKNDKYYRLAKAQGYRSRAAFKLTQLNKQYDFLEKSRVLIDLCAAPGGWCQVASKYMPAGSTIIGLDLLPIRKIPGVITYEEKNGGDITSPLCRTVLKKHIGGANADVVLCDGAPNVGGAWSKDAYGQSELALIACKLATEFLKRGGIFITKVFRSSDYTALLWVFQQLFKRVDSMKPSSSRNTSAEIFVVCRGFLKPDRIDPRLLDPKYAFKQVEVAKKVPDVLHKKVKQKRSRDGYDTSLGMTLHNECSVANFIEADSPEYLSILGQYSRMLFDERAKKFLEHPDTDDEIKACFADLKVLGKSDFKHLLKWRFKMIRMLQKERKSKKAEEEEEEEEDSKKMDGKTDDNDGSREEEDTSGMTKKQLEQLDWLRRKNKREKKKLREKKAKYQRRVDLGIEPGSAIDIVRDDDMFSLRQLRSDKVRDAVINSTVEVENPEAEVQASRKYIDRNRDSENSDDEEEDYTTQIENNLETLYDQYKAKKEHKSSLPVMLTSKGQNMTKRKRAEREAAILKQREEEVLENSEERQQERAQQYFQLLSKDASSSDEQDGSEGYDSEEEKAEINKRKNSNKKREEEKQSEKVVEKVSAAQTARWFSNPAFGSNNAMGESDSDGLSDDSDDGEDGDSEDSDDDFVRVNKDVMEVGEMPRTDKQIRKERRRKLVERNERREAKRRKKSENEFDEVPVENAKDDKQLEDEKKMEEIKQNIKAGMGTALNVKDGGKNFETVPQESNRFNQDINTDSDSSDDERRAHTLALGQLMLTHSKTKALVDASYNRYAWNDPDDLPSWFVQEEKEHNKPQLPVTKAMVQAAKLRLRNLNDAPMKKVAEARARKKERAVRRMQKAKRLAEKIADDDQLTAKTKMRAIAKAMAKTKTPRPGSVHVVVRKGGRSTVSAGAKGGKPKVKFVDRRMRSDMRGMKRVEKGKNGKRRKKGQKRGGRKRNKR